MKQQSLEKQQMVGFQSKIHPNKISGRSMQNKFKKHLLAVH
jgi:hypothetical protein